MPIIIHVFFSDIRVTRGVLKGACVVQNIFEIFAPFIAHGVIELYTYELTF